VAGIPRLAECEAGSVVGSPRGWFSVGALPVDIYAVGVIGSKVVSGEYVKQRVRTHVSVRRRCWRGAVCEVWFHLLRNVSDWRVYVKAVSSWRDCTAGLAVRFDEKLCASVDTYHYSRVVWSLHTHPD